MASKKYRSYGIRRENNLLDINNKKDALNNLLNNMPGVGNDITFISEDLDAIRGLKDTAITNEDFIGLAGSTPRITLVDELGNALLDSNGDPLQQVVEPLYRIEDRLRSYRKITEDPPIFASGTGPYAYFIPSTIIPELTKGSDLNSIGIDTIKVNPITEQSDDFWMFGEFSVGDRFKLNFPNSFGGVFWEGYYIPNPITTIHRFNYDTTGLFHVEYDRFADDNWEVVKSIYAKQRIVTVDVTATNTTVIQLAAGDTRYVSEGDYILGDTTNTITSISGNSITLTNPITIAASSTITFDMNLGQTRYLGTYNINEVLDRGELQIKKRIFWWYPFSTSYTPTIKYLRNRIVSSNRPYDFFNWSKERSSTIATPGSIRDTLNRAVTPAQQNMGSVGNEIEFKSTIVTNTNYIPKSAFSQINKVTTNISFQEGNRYIDGILTATEIGNVVVPSTIAAIPSQTFDVIPKNLRIKNLLGSGNDSPTRLVDQPTPVTSAATNVHVIDHLGLIDYFVASSTGNTVTVLDTSNLKKDMICITASTLTTSFIRITEIISSTQFRTSANLNLTNGYVFVYSNSGIVDRSLEFFCNGVFGQTVATTTAVGNTIELVSIVGVATGQVIQFIDAIPAGTTVTLITGNVLTLSASTTAIITQGETVVFAPSGTSVNKEICVLPLDLSPPFVGVPTGLSTDGKSIKGARAVLNVRTNKLTFNNATVSTVTGVENYDIKIDIKNIKNPGTGATYSIIGKLVI